MKEGYIKYKDKIIHIKIIKDNPEYKIVETEDMDILGIPSESGTIIYKTKEECEHHENHCFDWFVPQGE